MDKLVRRVTVIERGQHSKAKVIYSDTDDDDDDESPDLHRLERRVRSLLKADVIAAQEAYQRHLDSVAQGGAAWIDDSPSNMMRARRKAMKEIRGFGPPGMPPRSYDDEED
jgi:hypothetical protein